jgi:hypothetical protein
MKLPFSRLLEVDGKAQWLRHETRSLMAKVPSPATWQSVSLLPVGSLKNASRMAKGSLLFIGVSYDVMRQNRKLPLAMIFGVLAAMPLASPAQSPWGQGDNPAAMQADAQFGDYLFRDGEILSKVRIHYATLGAPHRRPDGEIDNAVLLLHWTGADGRALLTPTYMKALFNPGRPLDAQRYYLIFPDSIGHGRSSKPSNGLRMQFPRYGYADMVDLQHRLVTQILGIHRLHAILGISMGGMNAWQWAEAYPEEVEGVMPGPELAAPGHHRRPPADRTESSILDRRRESASEADGASRRVMDHG